MCKGLIRILKGFNNLNEIKYIKTEVNEKNYTKIVYWLKNLINIWIITILQESKLLRQSTVPWEMLFI